MAGRHRAADERPDPRSKTVEGRRPGAKHEGGAAKPRVPRKRAAPAKSAAAPTSSAPTSGAAGDRAGSVGESRRSAALRSEAREYAARQAYRSSAGGKPSVAGRTASGAAAGAATGAVLGTVVPGVGNAVGAGVGAAVGGAGGLASGAKARKAYKMATRSNGRTRRLIVIEFALCIVIVALSPLTDAKRDEPPAAHMKRFAAVVGLFFVLGLISAMGRGAATAAAGLGGLATVTLLVTRRDLLAKLADIFATPGGTAGGTSATGPMIPVVD